MAKRGKKKDKVSVPPPQRKQRLVCLMSEKEMQIVERYLKKYRITNRSRWLRETVLGIIYQKLLDDYPTLFNENDMKG